MVDQLPLDAPEAPRPRFRTLNLLVGRMTTIKLTYWAALTVWELWGPRGWSMPFATAASLTAMAWAAWSARHVDARDPVAIAVKCIGAGFAGTQRHLALGRPAPHQNRDVLHLGYLSIGADYNGSRSCGTVEAQP